MTDITVTSRWAASHATLRCAYTCVCVSPAGSYFFKQSQEHGARTVVKADKQLRADEKRARKKEYIAWEERGGDKLGPFAWKSTIREQLAELLVHKFDLKYGNVFFATPHRIYKSRSAMACVKAEVGKFVKGTTGLKGGLTVEALSKLERTIKKQVEDGDTSANGAGWCCAASSAAMKEGGPSLMAAMNEVGAAIEVKSGDDDDNDDDNDENSGGGGGDGDDDDGGGGGGGGETAVKTLTAEEVVQRPQLWALDLAKDKDVGVSRMARRDAYVLCGVEVLTAQELVDQAKRDAANAVDTVYERVMLKIDEALSPLM